MGLIERGTLFQLFWIPAVVSGGLLLLLWGQDSLPKHAPTFAAWWLLAVVLQFSAAAPIVWVCGLLLQTLLSVVLLIKYRMERI